MARFCSECGAPLEDGAHFCDACGHPVGQGLAEPAPAEPAAVEPAPVEPAPVATEPTSPVAGTPPRRRGLVVLAIVLVVALAGGAVYWFALRDDTASAGELFLEPASSTGPDPFTDSTTTGPITPTTTQAGGTTTTSGGNTVTSLLGSDVGLYGGTLDESACNVEQQIVFLQDNPEKARAFAGVLGIASTSIPSYLRGLTPVVLRYDTRVTNHGSADGEATERQSVLQAGTAVLVDEFGVPRVRCKCGNPLTPPTAIQGDVSTQGDAWPGYDPGGTVVVQGGSSVDAFTLVDLSTGKSFLRPVGTTGVSDTLVGGDQLTGLCGSDPDDAVSKLLAARRSGSRTATLGCANERVVDYLFALNQDFVNSLRPKQACEPAAQVGLTGLSADAVACELTNGAILVLERTQPRTDVGWLATQVVLVEQPPDSTTTTTGATIACTRPQVTPRGEGEKTLVAYFAAINDHDYATAYGLLSPSMQANWTAPDAPNGLTIFSNFMESYVRCVRVTAIRVVDNPNDPEVSASLGIQWYEVELDASYLRQLPAGAGVFETFFKVHADPHEGPGRPPNEIVASGTGL